MYGKDNEMNDLDERIQEALKGSDGNGIEIKEANLTNDLISVFRGRYRWWNAYIFVLNMVFFALAIWCANRFFGAETTKLQSSDLGVPL